MTDIRQMAVDLYGVWLRAKYITWYADPLLHFPFDNLDEPTQLAWIAVAKKAALE